MSRYNDLEKAIKSEPVACSHLGFGEQGAILSKLNSALAIFPDSESAKNMASQLESLGKKCIVIDDFSAPFTLSKFTSKESECDILRALYSLSKTDAILVSTPQILATPCIDLSDYKSKILTLKKGEALDFNSLESRLVFLGYKRVESVSMAGEFSRRGDILDIFPPTEIDPIRLDFFDTELDEIYSFDPISFEKKNVLTHIDITPNRLLIIKAEEKEKILSALNSEGKSGEIFLDLASRLERDENLPCEFLFPFYEKIVTFAELDLPIIISNHLQVETKLNKIFDSINEKIELIFKEKILINLYKNTKKYLNFNDFLKKFKNNLIFFENFDFDQTDLKFKLGQKEILKIDFKTKNFPSFLFNLDTLETAMKKYMDKQIYLCLSSPDTLNSIKQIFTETGVKFTLNKNSTGLILTELKIPYNICFEDEDKFYIGSTNFAHKKTATKKSSKAIKYLPKAGEYVVHSTHGIGKCEGIVNVKVFGIDKEFFKLVYRGGDVLYVPSENAECLSLYMADGDNVTLNKLGGKEFATQKLKAIKSIEDMSKELLELYAKRKATKGFKYSEDDYLYTEFEAKFPYTETADQLQAIADVKRDMISGKVMDRLICGDVGFGKTEVAMRAVFKAVENGKQVAILAPTTILSLQHYLTASERMKDFGVNVAMLNRFVSKTEQKTLVDDLKNGKIDVVCGTHRLLSSDVSFKDLGLLVLDEEQRFGVKAKEHIKQLKNDIDVLTLSATPIPRTLSMSLMTIRDISIINTPPVDRLAVKTYILAYNDEIILHAINEELSRGGQVLIVYNNIEKIYALCEDIKKKLNNPLAKFDVAHGQMSEIALENAIKRLYDKQTNVFVSTTLIENGVDLPSANTLVVIDSDKLGLSQMYQLRGRVGRSHEQAFAYFTYKSNKTLSEEASNRLQALAENTELGSGFKIAMRDLSIRGAGELLGKVQHGHIVKIGYAMYSKLLNDTLKRLKGEKVDEDREVKIDIAISSNIPYSFVNEESERLKIIAKISNINSKDSANEIIRELVLSYGKLPPEVYQLSNVALIKSLAKKQKIKEITLNKTKMAVTFYENADVDDLINRLKKFTHFKFLPANLPTISLNPSEFSVVSAQAYLIEFLFKA